MRKHVLVTLLAASITASLLSACAPLIVGGALVGGSLVATDRRTSGTQIEDQGIEMKAGSKARDVTKNQAHININGYNRQVLLTGEVGTQEEKQAVELAVAKIENVRRVFNELAVMPNSSIGSRSNDALLHSKIKASLVDTKDLISNAFYVVVERGEVFLAGRVTQREADRATEIARGVSGVKKVVRIFEIVSEDALADYLPATGSGQK